MSGFLREAEFLQSEMRSAGRNEPGSTPISPTAGTSHQAWRSEEIEVKAHPPKIGITVATRADEFAVGRELFKEYADNLGIDLCFQNFQQELEQIDKHYGPPRGRLFLGYEQDTPVGCVAFRPMDSSTCEMKRLFVRPAYRFRGTGRLLVATAMNAARTLGYARMRLDTLSSMAAAIALYESCGFTRRGPYYQNPHPGAVFFERRLV